MSATSVGQIGLDLVVNQKQFNKQMTGIQSLAKKVGKTLAAAFAVSKVVEFGKECIELGSDLEEVQNVVNVTFPTMTDKVNEFAQSAAGAFGLSETMAKQYTSTLGSMAKAFGFTESQAYDMGTTLAGLAGDVASFYNLSQDEAYTKLKSVFTGETESLKDLGVVMTQTALDSYALASGFGKTTSAMSEAEKVALRYAFVQDKLSAAQGDFARTSNSWANQVKVLNLQFESLKATIGQGLISAFTPVLKMLNQLIAKVQVLATSFKDMMEGIFGAQEAEAIASATETMADSTAEVAENLKSASEYVAGFDEINKFSDSTSGSSTDTSALDVSALATAEKQAEASTNSSLSAFKRFEAFLSKKFSPSVRKASAQFETSFESIKTTAAKVFNDVKKLAESFANFLKGPFCSYIALAFETVSGIFAGRIDSWNRIFQDVWNVVVAPLLNKFVNEWLPVMTDIATKYTTLMGNVASKTKAAFDKVWNEAAKPVLEFLSQAFQDFMNILAQFWNDWGEPIFTKLQEALDKTSEALSILWSGYFKPTFDQMMSAIRDIWDNYLAPLLANFMDFVGELTNCALVIYNKFIVPLVSAFAEKFQPVISKVIEFASDVIKQFLGVLNGIITAVKGIIQFITGVFTGDWEKAWEGVKNIFKGVFDGLVAIVKTPVNQIIGIINSMISGIVSGVNTVIKAINSISFTMPDWLGGQTVGFNLQTLTAPKIPKLASGGYVKKNTPQLAMIGDNRHQGEVVAPEDKLKEMAMAAVAAASGNDYSLEILKVLKEILVVLKALDLDIVIDGKKLKDIIVEKINQHTRQTGVCEIII